MAGDPGQGFAAGAEVPAAATAGTFAALTYLGGPRRAVNTIDELAGLSGSHTKTAAALSVFMFSLTGLPPPRRG